MQKTEPKNYHGCHPDIACALKRSEDIWCIHKNHPDQKVLVTAYIHGADYPYKGTNEKEGRDLEPLETRTYHKKASEIIEWLEDNGYESDSCGTWGKKNCLGFNYKMYELCGKPNCTHETNEHEWLPEWLEER